MEMQAAEALFFEKMPRMLPVYQALREKLDQRQGEIEVKVGKTQISLRNKYVFAAVSLPYRRIPGVPREYLLVSFGLSHRVESPRILQAVQPYKNRWTHHVAVADARELDGELMGWLEEAFAFSMVK